MEVPIHTLYTKDQITDLLLKVDLEKFRKGITGAEIRNTGINLKGSGK
jgi:hypothetical protein